MGEPALPDTISPMLAGTADPFDSDEHVFEIKWDGLRALAFVERQGRRIHNRRGTIVTPRYPELDGLAALSTGCVLDGEIVVLRDGRPDFQALQSRWNVASPRRVAALAREAPVTFVAFDLLYVDHVPLLDEPLVVRRERLADVLEAHVGPRLAGSEGVTGPGRAYFDEAARQGLEGIMAKRLGSRYRPGHRGDSWLKIKCRKSLLCAIIGYVTEGNDLRSLIVAAPEEGRLRCVGRVGSGLGERERSRLLSLLRESPREEPIVPSRHRGHWVEPCLYGRVEYQEITRGGDLRAPVWKGLVDDEGRRAP